MNDPIRHRSGGRRLRHRSHRNRMVVVRLDELLSMSDQDLDDLEIIGQMPGGREVFMLLWRLQKEETVNSG